MQSVWKGEEIQDTEKLELTYILWDGIMLMSWPLMFFHS